MRDLVKDMRSRVDRLKGRRDRIEDDLNETKQALSRTRKAHKKHLLAREVIREVGIATQEKLSFHVQDVVTLALEGVFPNPYEFQVQFVLNRNRTECVLALKNSDGSFVDPMDAAGGGVVDVVSFALRVASWSMASPRTSPVLILDEPFRFLSRDLKPAAGEMLRQIADRLGLQIIMVTHEEPLIEIADRVFRVSKDRSGRSLISSD